MGPIVIPRVYKKCVKTTYMNWWKVFTELCYDTWSSALQG